MTTLAIHDDTLEITVQGADKVWALKSHLSIPLAHIARVEYAPEIARAWYHGLKAPGTNIPGVITAGTFYKAGQKVFWDVHHPDKTIVIYLHDESYQQLVIEVEEPQLAINSIQSALEAKPPQGV